MLKPFDRFACHLAMRGPITHCVRRASLTSAEAEIWELDPQPKLKLNTSTYDLLGGSTDRHFHALPSYFDHSLHVVASRLVG